MSESVTLLQRREVSNDDNISCQLNYHPQRIHSKGAILCLLVRVLISIGNQAMLYATVTIAATVLELHFVIYLVSLLTLFSPIAGWIADAWLGRYQVIKVGIWTCLVGNILAVSATLTSYTSVSMFSHEVFEVLAYIGLSVSLFGDAAITANIIQFSLDQCLGASGDELSAVIHWNIWPSYFANCICNFLRCFLLLEKHILHITVPISIVFSIITTIVFYIGKRWLDTTHRVTNPIKLIVQVITYARKNKHPRNRSAFTYWEENYPSRLDLGKEKYGGPFSEEEVEDVRTVLQLVPLLVCLVTLGLAGGPSLIFQYANASFNLTNACIINLLLPSMAFVVMVPLYHFVINPLFYKCIPKMLTKVAIGTIILFLSIVAYFGLDTYARVHADDTIDCLLGNETVILPLDYKWQILPQSLYALGDVIMQIFSLEFVAAQTPQKMKGLTIGLWYSLYGLGLLMGYNFNYPFQSIKSSSWLSCDFYYYLTEIVLALAIIMLFSLLAKRYKLRIREREINVHLIAEEHYERYMDQEEDYWRENDYSYGP